MVVLRTTVARNGGPRTYNKSERWLGSVMVRVSDSHMEGPGSIPADVGPPFLVKYVLWRTYVPNTKTYITSNSGP